MSALTTMPIADGLVVPLRRGFEPYLNGDKVQRVDDNGQPQWVAEAVVAGRVNSAFALDNPRVDAVRLVTAGANPAFGTGAMVELSGEVKVTAWYNPRARGTDANSGVTITASQVREARGKVPVLSGGLPASLPPEMAFTHLGMERDNEAVLMAPPEGPFTVNGIARLMLSQPAPTELIGQPVSFSDLTVFFSFPDDRGDVSMRTKSALYLRATALVPVSSPGNGRRDRKVEAPAPEQSGEVAA